MFFSYQVKRVSFFIFLFASFFFHGCSSVAPPPILTKKLKLTIPEQKKLETDLQISSSVVPKPSSSLNLSQFSYPTENELLFEARFQNKDLYLESVSVLSDWVQKKLSQKEKSQLVQNCETLVGNFQDEFPLDEQTLACSAWWLEKKYVLSLVAQRASRLQKEAPALEALSSKQKKDWVVYKDLDFSDAFLWIDPDSFPKATALAKQAVGFAKDCSYKNASSALIFRLEAFLPSPIAYRFMETLYTRMQSCLLPNEEPSEKLNLRMGILRLMYGNSTLALQALEKTQLEKKPQENSRSLFWLGAVYQKDHPKAKNPWWQRLLEESPISLAATVACQQMGIDPMNLLVSDEEVVLAHREDKGWNKQNLEAFLFELFLARKENQAAFDFSLFAAKTVNTTNPSLLLYWAYCENKMQNYNHSILFLGKYIRYQKNFKASRTILNLQYPVLYLDEITSARTSIDPIFLLALMRQESAFDPNARSIANARGLMQVLPTTAKIMRKKTKPEELYDPQINIDIGSAYIERLFKKYDGKTEYVLAAYNAGALNLNRWLTRVPSTNTMLFSDYIPFRETRNYVSLILRNYYWYGRLIALDKSPFAKKILKKSLAAQWKSDSVEALLVSFSGNLLSESQKALLNKIYIFGDDAPSGHDVSFKLPRKPRFPPHQTKARAIRFLSNQAD